MILIENRNCNIVPKAPLESRVIAELLSSEWARRQCALEIDQSRRNICVTCYLRCLNRVPGLLNLDFLHVEGLWRFLG
jgi:hypothetical protein